MNIDRFKQDHVDFFSSVTELRHLVQSGVREHAAELAKRLVSISSAIKMHLAAEDRMLYPALERSADAVTAQTGRQFREEMGSLAPALNTFMAHWSLASRITADPQGFRDDANAVFKALHQRVQRENRELYPLAERL